MSSTQTWTTRCSRTPPDTCGMEAARMRGTRTGTTWHHLPNSCWTKNTLLIWIAFMFSKIHIWFQNFLLTIGIHLFLPGCFYPTCQFHHISEKFFSLSSIWRPVTSSTNMLGKKRRASLGHSGNWLFQVMFIFILPTPFFLNHLSIMILQFNYNTFSHFKSSS